MIREEQNPSPDDMRKVLRLMRISMRNNAMQHFGRIDIRTLRILQDLDLFKDMADSIGDHVDITMLKDLSHPRRENLPPGPLIVYRTEGQPPKRVLVELPLLLFSEILDVRKAALECLSQMIQSDSLAVTPKTGSDLENLCKSLISDVPSEWRSAAVGVADALNDDFFIALQGARQSLEYDPVIQDRLDFYAPKVIRPAISSLDSISLHISNPENEHEQITDMIGQIIAKAQTLTDVCADYYRELGFFPLAPQFGMGEAVRHWLATHTVTDPWKEVWDWVNATAGPVPRYHACCVFVLHPELVPQGRMHDLWKEVLGVVYEPARKGSDQPEHEEWALRHALARHYAYHLEAHLPDNNGAKISCFAWWISEQVAGLFPRGPEAARFFREKWVMPALEMSSSIWLGAIPHIQGSPLRYMTLTGPSPWAVGLLSIMSGKLELLAPGEQSEEVRSQFHDALVHHAISSLPFPVQNSSAPTFAFECSLAEMILKWAKYQPAQEQEAIEQLVVTSQGLNNTDELCKALKKIAESPLADQIAVALSLRAKAYTDQAIAEGIWEVLSDADWRLKVLVNVETRVLGLLFEAFSIVQVNSRGKWFSLFPHYIAELCEIADDREQRRLFFLYLLHISLASDTVSAVRRLLRGDHKKKFAELVREYRDRAEAMRSEYPPWVAGKLRGLIANLRIV